MRHALKCVEYLRTLYLPRFRTFYPTFLHLNAGLLETSIELPFNVQSL
ncbi:MAG: hypothetical protein LBB19_03050 [Puniceicoccales bacterium]|nr:hypothetical protein [Puniceicoccales bacterium]